MAKAKHPQWVTHEELEAMPFKKLIRFTCGHFTNYYDDDRKQFDRAVKAMESGPCPLCSGVGFE